MTGQGPMPIEGRGKERHFVSRVLARPASPRALLFTGLEGVGKSRMALWSAQSFLCPDLDVEGPCSTCRECRQAEGLIHPDLHLFMPHNALKVQGEKKQEERYAEHRAQVIQAVRDGNPGAMSHSGDRYSMAAIRALRRAALKPSWGEAGRRSVVIDQAEALGQGATANALLKLLEDTPPGLRIFMTARSPGALPDTLRSRVMQIRLAPLGPEAIRTLAENAGVQDETRIEEARGRPGRLIEDGGETEQARKRAEVWGDVIRTKDTSAVPDAVQGLPLADNDGAVAHALAMLGNRLLDEAPDVAARVLPAIENGERRLERNVVASVAVYATLVEAIRARDEAGRAEGGGA